MAKQPSHIMWPTHKRKSASRRRKHINTNKDTK